MKGFRKDIPDSELQISTASMQTFRLTRCPRATVG